MRIHILSTSSRIYSTYRLLTAGKERGHDINVIDHTKCYSVIEMGKPEIYFHGTKLSKPDAIIPRIGVSVTFYGTALVRQFELKKIYSTVQSEGIAKSRDKLHALQILSLNGIPIPKTAIAKHPDDIPNLIEAVGGAPIIIKLMEGTQGLGVVLAETRNAAQSVIEAFYGINVNILVQEFIKEAAGTDIRAFVVGSEIVAAIKRSGQKGDFRSNLHRGGTAEPVKLTPQEKQIAIHSAKVLGLGVAGVDILRSARGPLVMEVNPSPGLQGIEGATKVNIAKKIIQLVERNIYR